MRRLLDSFRVWFDIKEGERRQDIKSDDGDKGMIVVGEEEDEAAGKGRHDRVSQLGLFPPSQVI